MANLAIVGPNFFSYTEAIAAEFARRGFAVSTYDEKRSNSVAAKAACRLGTHSRSRLRKHLDGLANHIIASGGGEVLLVGVEVIDRAFVARLTSAGLRVHLYMWDGQANKGRFRDYLDLLTSAASFDPRDAIELGMTYIPLFAEPVFERRARQMYDVGFCGTMHTGRVAAIAKLLVQNLRLGLKLYYHSRALFLAKGGALSLLPLISTKASVKAEVAELFASSRYVLDIPHPGQTGLTARTFEALLAGSRVLTTNARAADFLPPSLRDRVSVIDQMEDVAAIVRAKRCEPTWLSAGERYFLSLQRFGDDLLKNMRPKSIVLQTKAA
jgi:NAD(P)-dependent dehydrogenase (short-subunit alcohol dehydrogenase family)